MKSLSINCKGKIIDFSKPQIMGIINITPDSFYKSTMNTDEILRQAETMLKNGADILDIGAVSSKPGASFVDEEEELKRILINVEKISSYFPEAVLSIDTTRSRVAEECILHGASIINDISFGSEDENIFFIADKYSCPYIGMHRQGTPKTMQQNPQYDDVVKDVAFYFKQKINNLIKYPQLNLILDIGIGFGKTIDHNFQLINNLSYFQKFQKPLLLGISRKSFLYKSLNTTPDKVLEATAAVHLYALNKGANILRVHDVKEAKEICKIAEFLK